MKKLYIYFVECWGKKKKEYFIVRVCCNNKKKNSAFVSGLRLPEHCTFISGRSYLATVKNKKKK